MNLRLTSLRAAAVVAVFGALALAGCGGGGAKSVLPASSSNGSTNTNAANNGVQTMTAPNGQAVPAALLTVSLPQHTSAQSSTTNRVAIFSAAKKPDYIDTTTTNSALVVAVTPQDPSEASQLGNLTVCYNLYTNGTLAASNPPNFVVTTSGPNVASTVTIAVPAPPGTDGFQITQYSGQCGSSIFTLPTPPPGNLGSSNILAQTPVTEAYMAPGAANNLNQQIFNCTPAPAAGQPCPLTTANNGTSVFSASAVVANIAFGTLPITSPVREQGAFLAAPGKIGIPIPLEALTSSGGVMPGLTTPLVPAGGAGPFPSGVTVTTNDATGTTALVLVDAKTGVVAQGPANTITIHEFNALSDNTIAGVLMNNCGASGTASCQDNTAGGTGGDPWVLVLTFKGTNATAFPGPVTVTATATIPPSTTATVITTSIQPQSAVYTAGAGGYADATAPAVNGLGLLVNGATTYISAGSTVSIDGGGAVSPAAGAALGGMTFAQWPNLTTNTAQFVYAVDSAQASGTSATEVASGLYSFTPSLGAMLPVAAQSGGGNYMKFNKPVGVVQAPFGGNDYLFVIDSTGAIYRVDISNNGANDGNGFQLATNVSPSIATSGTALSPGTAKMVGTALFTSGTEANSFLVADPGNNRIAEINATNSPAVISSYATCPSCTGITLSGTSGALYATSTTGQVYYISAKGATAVSLGLPTGTAADGPIGQVPSLTPATTPTLTATAYPLQFAANNFFNAGALTGLSTPYTLAPFTASTVWTVSPAAALGLIADTAAVATAGKVNATGGIIVVPSTATAGAVTTPDSIEFIDANGKLRTLVH